MLCKVNGMYTNANYLFQFLLVLSSSRAPLGTGWQFVSTHHLSYKEENMKGNPMIYLWFEIVLQKCPNFFFLSNFIRPITDRQDHL